MDLKDFDEAFTNLIQQGLVEIVGIDKKTKVPNFIISEIFLSRISLKCSEDFPSKFSHDYISQTSQNLNS